MFNARSHCRPGLRTNDLTANGLSPAALESLEPRLLLSADVSGQEAMRSGYAETVGLDWQAQPYYVTADTAGSHVTTPGESSTAFGLNHDGVAKLIVSTAAGTFLCSGALLWTGQHILTAAHCLTDSLGQLIATSVQANFSLASGNVSVTSSDITVHPSWDGLYFENANDLAIIELPSVVTTVPGYHIWEGSGELNRQTIKVGNGQSGHGSTGATLSAGTERAGLNRYDSDGGIFASLGAANGVRQLAYDFDNGKSANDAFGYFYGINELGYGNDEVGSAPGDSGGPTFAYDSVDGRFEIVGVTSFGFRLASRTGGTSDVDSKLNSSFGEFSVDTRVSAYADFIKSNAATPATEPNPVNSSPTAHAGADQSVTAGQTVQLDGSLSSDPDGNALSYQWQIIAWPGSQPVLSSSTAVKPTFVADEAGTYDLQLTVTDAGGLSHSDTVRIVAAEVSSVTTMHVADIDGAATVKGKSGKWEAQVSVLVVDASGAPVTNATVTGSFGGSSTAKVSGTTGSNGRVTLLSGNISGGTSVTFTVNNVTGVLGYDPTANADAEGDSTGTFIRIYRNGTTSATSTQLATLPAWLDILNPGSGRGGASNGRGIGKPVGETDCGCGTVEASTYSSLSSTWTLADLLGSDAGRADVLATANVLSRVLR